MPSTQVSNRVALVSLLLAFAALFLVACGGNGGDGSEDGSVAAAGLPHGAAPVDLNPADFSIEIDNPYWPMRPGSRWVYREADGGGEVQRVVVTVTQETKRIANGIEARVVHDVVSQGGEPVEIT